MIGVLGTRATVRQGYVDDLAARFAADCRVVRHGSAELVDLAEAKLRGESVAGQAIAAAVAPLARERAIDTVVLACTHFPLLADELRVAFGPAVRFVDGAAGIARRIATLTAGQDWAGAGQGVAVFTRSARCAPTELRPAFASYGFATLEQL